LLPLFDVAVDPAKAAGHPLRPSIDAKGVMYVLDGLLPLPAARRREAAAELHAGHDGERVMRRRAVSAGVWRPSIAADLRECAARCITCQHTREHHEALGQPLHPYVAARFERWFSDVLHLPTLGDGSPGFVFTAVESATGFLVASQIAAADGPNVADAFERLVVLVYGPPDVLRCDGGPENAIAQELGAVCARYNTSLEPTMPGDSNAIGLLDRRHRELNKRLARLLLDLSSSQTLEAFSWPRVLARAVHMINSAPRSDSSVSAFEAMHGSSPRTSLDAVMPISRVQRRLAVQIAQSAELTSLAASAELLRARQQRATHDKAAGRSQFAVGDRVLFAYTLPSDRGNKLGRRIRWTGPARVVQVAAQGRRLLLLNEDSGRLVRHTHFSSRFVVPFLDPRGHPFTREMVEAGLLRATHS